MTPTIPHSYAFDRCDECGAPLNTKTGSGGCAPTAKREAWCRVGNPCKGAR